VQGCSFFDPFLNCLRNYFAIKHLHAAKVNNYFLIKFCVKHLGFCDARFYLAAALIRPSA
jgi:hypothetical protein